MRINTYGWPEEEALSFRKTERPVNGKKSPKSPRPGVRYGPLTPAEIGTLRAFSEGMTTRELADARKTSLRAIRRILERLRLKLGVYTNYEMMYKVGRERIIE